MRIVKLEAENVKRLRAVSITPGNGLVKITGRNGEGKTSVLDAIAMALGGEALCPPEPIRRGEERARVTVEMDEDLVVERRWTANDRSYLEVRTKNGAKYKSPQKLLDGLVGKLSYDPLAFMRMESKQQAATLAQLVGVDLAPLDQRRKQVYDQRTGVNRLYAQLQARAAAMPDVGAGVPDEPVTAADLLEEQQRRQKERAVNDVRRAALGAARGRFADAKRGVERAAAEVERARAALAAAEQAHQAALAAKNAAASDGKALEAEVSALVDPDLDEVLQQLRSVEATNELVRRKKDRARALAEAEQSKVESDKLTAAIEAIDQEKAAALASAKFPIEGLSFDENGVRFKDVPLEQASAAEQLRVALAMGIALNPKLRVQLIRDASLLDAKSLALVAEMAAAADQQVWLEIVSDAAGVGVVIEDGAVAGEEAAGTPTVPVASNEPGPEPVTEWT